jgi:hypothetical protein
MVLGNSVKPLFILIANKTSENPKDWAISSAGNQIKSLV